MKLFTHLEIETIGSCNRTCNTCLRQSTPEVEEKLHQLRTVNYKVGEGVQLPDAVFRRVVDQAKDLGFEGRIGLQHYNEPLLDPRLPTLARYVKEQLPASQLSFCSNMDLITPETAQAFDGVVDFVNVALYMPPERQRRREEELRSMFEATELRFTKGVHVVTHHSPFTNLQPCIDAVIDTPCTSYNHMFIVACDGTVLHCCDDYTGHFGLGNVAEQSVKEIWYGDHHRDLVTTLASRGGRREHPYCASCPRP